MEEEHLHEPELLLPPWPQRRRRLTTILMIGFILLASGLIGFGIYQVGISSGILTPPFSKKLITQALLSDASFLRAIKQAGSRRECSNVVRHITLIYTAPFKPLQTTGANACLAFVTLHPTGADVMVKITEENISREQLTADFSASFTTVQTDFVSGTNYETTQLSGILKDIPTTIYVIRTEPKKSWVITYTPTSPTLDAIVAGMASQFQLQP